MQPSPSSLPLSVVIPSRDRCDRLVETLRALDQQGELGAEFEVLVVDDGSTDSTPELLRQFSPATYQLRPTHQRASGPSVARNRAIALASGERVLLLGDDTRPSPGALAEHLLAANGEEVGVQGHIDWDPRQEITALMKFLAPAGPQFYFAGLDDGSEVPYTAVLGSNFSAPTRWFRRQPFDETFPAAAFEDTELAYRWQRQGWRVKYHRAALCWHHHHYDQLGPFLDRQRRAGRAARHALLLHPGMASKVLLQPALWGGWLALRQLLPNPRRQHDAWDLRCRGAFFRGLLVG